ncbi:MAG: FHA domain-containing protein [Planctomycetota bacterium]
MTPLSETLNLLRSTSARGFAERHPDQDLVLLEPYEKDRSYDYSSPLHPGATMRFLPRAVGSPVPVGRDSRALVLLDHPAVSRLHAVLAYTQGGWKIMDRSSNGSFFGEQRLPRDQAVDLPYGSGVRFGRALVLRLFPPEEFHRYASESQRGGAPVAAAPAPPSADRVADTWRIPAQYVQAAQQARDPFAENTLEIDFQFDGPPQGEAPTVRIRRDTGPANFPVATPHESLPRPPKAPQAPIPPAPPAPPNKVSDGDIDYEFDFDIEGDGRGGF